MTLRNKELGIDRQKKGEGEKGNDNQVDQAYRYRCFVISLQTLYQDKQGADTPGNLGQV